MADSCDVWQKPTQFCKAITLQLKKIHLKLKKINKRQLEENIWQFLKKFNRELP